MDSPRRSELSLGSLGIPSAGRRVLPTPPEAGPSSLKAEEHNTRSYPRTYSIPTDVPLDPHYSFSPTATSPSVPGLVHSPTTATSHPSPHDWHDGSSSITNDPYGTAALPTSFITSLLSSTSNSDGGRPDTNPRRTLKRRARCKDPELTGCEVIFVAKAWRKGLKN